MQAGLFVPFYFAKCVRTPIFATFDSVIEALQDISAGWLMLSSIFRQQPVSPEQHLNVKGDVCEQGIAIWHEGLVPFVGGSVGSNDRESAE